MRCPPAGAMGPTPDGDPDEDPPAGPEPGPAAPQDAGKDPDPPAAPGGSADAPERGPGEARRPAGSLLTGGSASAILAALVPRDPLGIAARCRRHVLEQALLVDPARLASKAFARAAWVAAAHGPPAEPLLEAWLDVRVGESLADLLAEDEDRERRSLLPAPEHRAFLATVARLASVAPHHARRFCLAYHRLPRSERQPFFQVVLEGRAVREVARQLDLPPAEVAASVAATHRRLRRLAGEEG